MTTSSRLFAFIPATRIVAAGMSVSQQHVKVYVTKDHALHLANLAERDLSLSACELFGFGLGSWSLLVQGPDQAVLKVLGHVSLFQSRHFLLLCGIGTCSFSGVARQSVRQCFPWLLASDADAVVSVDGGRRRSWQYQRCCVTLRPSTALWILLVMTMIWCRRHRFV